MEIHPHNADGGACIYRSEQYERGLWIRPPWRPFLRGQACHAARSWALTRWLEDKELPKLEHVFDTLGEWVETEAETLGERGLEVSPEEVTAIVDEAVPITEADYRLNLPVIAPTTVAVEEHLTMDLGEDVVLDGRVDHRGVEPSTESQVITDLKTTKKSPGSQAAVSAALSLQLSLYDALVWHHFGSIPLHSLNYVWVMKRGPSKAVAKRDRIRVQPIHGGVDAQGKNLTAYACARTLTTQRSATDIQAALRRVRMRVDSKRHHWFPPAYSGGFAPECARCPHWGHEELDQRCPWVPETRPMEAAQKEEE